MTDCKQNHNRFMESTLTTPENLVSQLNASSSSNSAVFHPHSFHHCFPHNCCPSYHWVNPSNVRAHAHPRCPNSFKLIVPEHTKTNQYLTAEKVPHVCPFHSNASSRLAPTNDKHHSLVAAGQYYAVQAPCFCRPFHPPRTPAYPHHHFFLCRAHRCCQHPCLLPTRSSFPPFSLCSMPRPVASFPSMPPFCPVKSGHSGSDMKNEQTFSGNVAEEPISSHMGTEYDIWNENGTMEDAYEIEEEEDEPTFVLTDEWMEFFAKSEARRQQKKKQQQKEAKKMRKAERLASKKHDDEVEVADSFVHASKEGNTSDIS